MKEKIIMLGNEAIARGVYEAGGGLTALRSDIRQP